MPIKQGAAGSVQVVEPKVRFALVHAEPRAWLAVVVGQPEARAFSQLCFQTATQANLEREFTRVILPR